MVHVAQDRDDSIQDQGLKYEATSSDDMFGACTQKTRLVRDDFIHFVWHVLVVSTDDRGSVYQCVQQKVAMQFDLLHSGLSVAHCGHGFLCVCAGEIQKFSS